MFIEIYETDFLNVSDVIKNAESRIIKEKNIKRG